MNEVGQLIAELGGLGTITPAGALIVTVLLIIHGSLMPRRYYDDMREERDQWKQFAIKRLNQQSAQLEAISRSQTVTVAVAEAVQKTAQPGPPETPPKTEAASG